MSGQSAEDEEITPRSILSRALVGERPYDQAGAILNSLERVGWTVARQRDVDAVGLPTCDDCEMAVQHAPDCMVSSLVTVRNGPEYQGITLWCGDRLPVHVDDFMTSSDLRDVIQNPTLRAVAIARLRSIADLLAQPEEAPDA